MDEIKNNALTSLVLYQDDFSGTLSNPTHSARIVEAGTASKPLATIYVYSKWGSAGLYKHRVTNVPEGYDESNVTVWHPEWEEEE